MNILMRFWWVNLANLGVMYANLVLEELPNPWFAVFISIYIASLNTTLYRQFPSLPFGRHMHGYVAVSYPYVLD